MNISKLNRAYLEKFSLRHTKVFIIIINLILGNVILYLFEFKMRSPGSEFVIEWLRFPLSFSLAAMILLISILYFMKPIKALQKIAILSMVLSLLTPLLGMLIYFLSFGINYASISYGLGAGIGVALNAFFTKLSLPMTFLNFALFYGLSKQMKESVSTIDL